MSQTDQITWGRKTKDAETQQKLKRRVLLDVAAHSFSTKGYSSTSLDDLASIVDVSKPALYYYVKNKEDILIQCVEISLGKIMEALEAADQEESNGLERLRAYFIRYADIVVGDYGYALIREGNKHLRDENLASIKAMMRDGQNSLEKFTTLGIQDGSIAPCAPKHVAHLLFSAFNQMAFWYNPEGPSTPAEIAEQILNIAINGLAPRA